MRMLNQAGLLCLLGAAMILGGCTKEVTFVFNNTTEVQRTVQVARSMDVPELVGTLAPASTMEQKFKFKTDKLPTVVNVDGGEAIQRGSVTINDDTPDRIWIDFTKNGFQARTSKHTYVEQKTETKGPKVVVDQRPVITGD